MSKVHIHLTAASSSSTTAKKKHNNGKNTFSPTSLKINKILKASDFVTVEGLDLNTISKEMVMTTVADLIRKHGLIVIKHGSNFNFHGQRQAEVTSWLSQAAGGSGLVYNNHMRHSKEEAPEVFRISNNPDEGIVGVGAGAWHHDSLHLEQIPPYAMYHMRSVVNDVPEGAATWFSRSICPDTVSDELKEKLIRLQGFYLPTGQKHSLYNKNLNTILPPTQYGIVEFDQDQFVRKLDDVEKKKLSYTYHKLLLTKTIPSEEEVENAVQNIVDNNIMSKVRMIEKEGIEKGYVYRHCWEEGDVVITDNLRIAHRAPSAAEMKDVKDLRILHRSIAMQE